MNKRLNVELRKVNGRRFARFKLLDTVETDSKEEIQINAALRECDITPSPDVGVFRHQQEGADGVSVSCIGGIDIPVDVIQRFTNALTNKGFRVV